MHMPAIFQPADQTKFYALFQQFEHFTNYIHFAIEFLTPEIWVDDEEQPAVKGRLLTHADLLSKFFVEGNF